MGRSGLFLVRLARRIWFRAALLTVCAVALALIAGVFGTLIPVELTMNLGQGAVGSILQILASSMLAVTTFSLTAMVTAYSSATTQATPRSTQLLMDDTTSQTVLSTFVGSFVFSLVGIIALSTGYYTDEGRTILFLGTLAVIVIVVVTLLRWIAHLTRFGRVADVIDRTENAATDAVRRWASAPTAYAATASGVPGDGDGDGDGGDVYAESTGYVGFVDLASLQAIAQRSETRLAVLRMPGTMADASGPIVRVIAGTLPAQEYAAVRRAFHVENHRTFDQDPRLGVIALAEIGSRALSPATNDPGTAIDVLGSLQRVFAIALGAQRSDEVRYDRIEIEPVSLDDLLDDGFRPIARDGAAVIEVALRLQKTLAALAAASPARAAQLRAVADDARRRADSALPAQDRETLHALTRQLWA
ncbi:DUF2254 domain-containing protein [uncultured Microbacterium sp.]|uniref:DUF2254 domain-containing protein n=1 Tax=uncultured Microbacterium sp. TaxID=191216 RepID=UPI0025F05845|nr:DUF2254 domain-containing protein [uncultured Microbacterium sp.]